MEKVMEVDIYETMKRFSWRELAWRVGWLCGPPPPRKVVSQTATINVYYLHN